MSPSLWLWKGWTALVWGGLAAWKGNVFVLQDPASDVLEGVVLASMGDCSQSPRLSFTFEKPLVEG